MAVMAIDRPRSSAGDAVPDPGDTPELFAVEMDQLAGPLALVAHNHRLWFERRQLAQAEPAQDRAHRRDRQAELAGQRSSAKCSMHRSSVPNRAANSRSPAIRSLSPIRAMLPKGEMADKNIQRTCTTWTGKTAVAR